MALASIDPLLPVAALEKKKIENVVKSFFKSFPPMLFKSKMTAKCCPGLAVLFADLRVHRIPVKKEIII
jgi:hypothetical protein